MRMVRIHAGVIFFLFVDPFNTSEKISVIRVLLVIKLRSAR